eukprot:TRINITY_DN46101_c0_g1_i1.p1 TRINITY_DN46101_c0_g1~~TRINITY_DN46101_c0_g1_i1.p1  ORF type:complete len:346 (-),score=64.34 TRINITY_DN46101_c0_g1_i1:136-1173(-)
MDIRRGGRTLAAPSDSDDYEVLYQNAAEDDPLLAHLCGVAGAGDEAEHLAAMQRLRPPPADSYLAPSSPHGGPLNHPGSSGTSAGPAPLPGSSPSSFQAGASGPRGGLPTPSPGHSLPPLHAEASLLLREPRDGHERCQIATAVLSQKVFRLRRLASHWERWARVFAGTLGGAVFLLIALLVNLLLFQPPVVFLGGSVVDAFTNASIDLRVNVMAHNPNVRACTLEGASLDVAFTAPSPDFGGTLTYRATEPVLVRLGVQVPAGGGVSEWVSISVPIDAMPRRADLLSTPASVFCRDQRARFLAVSVAGAVRTRIAGATDYHVVVNSTSQLFTAGTIMSYLACPT